MGSDGYKISGFPLTSVSSSGAPRDQGLIWAQELYTQSDVGILYMQGDGKSCWTQEWCPGYCSPMVISSAINISRKPSRCPQEVPWYQPESQQEEAHSKGFS